GGPVGGEDGGAVAVGVVVDHLDRLVDVGDPEHDQDRAEDLLLVDLHAGEDLVEQGRPDVEALVVAIDAHVAPVQDQLGALVDAGLDQARHLVAGGPGARRAHVGGGVEAGTGAQPPGPLQDLVDQGVAGLAADGHGGGDGHAALAGGAVGGRHQRVGGRVHVGGGHEDGGVLGPP